MRKDFRVSAALIQVRASPITTINIGELYHLPKCGEPLFFVNVYKNKTKRKKRWLIDRS